MKVNQLITTTDRPHECYSADGMLDGSFVSVSSTPLGGPVSILGGLSSIFMTPSAAHELGEHLIAAAKACDDQLQGGAA